MNHLEPELEKAWEELSFWRDFAVWWKAERGNTAEPRILEALDEAERRYEQARDHTSAKNSVST
jgi:hypothetical protein